MEKTGYHIMKNRITIPNSVINDFHLQIQKSAAPIFNTKRNDNRRIQRNLTVNRTNRRFMEQINQIIKEINPLLDPSDWTILSSKPGCKRQLAHLDYEYTDDFRKITEEPEKIPLLVLVGLEPNTSIYIWPNSIEIIQQKYKGLPDGPTRIELEPGDILIFRADMIHAGSEYEDINIRLHCYLDSPFLHRNPNRTWIIQKHATDYFREVVLE